jgi:hypothetical protein
MLQSFRSHRRPVVALALAAALATALLLAPPGASQAATKTGHDFTYYSDASHTTVVGYRYYCPNYSGGWGRFSSFYEVNVFPCH